MSLETVLWVLFISPFAIGMLSAFFGGGNAITPVIVDYRSSQSVQPVIEKEATHESEFLIEPKLVLPVNEHSAIQAQKLEESPHAMDILQDIPANNEEMVTKPIQYEVSNIPQELNNSIDELFNALHGNPNEDVLAHIPAEENHQIFNQDFPSEFELPVTDYEDFEIYTQSIDERLDQMDSNSQNTSGVVYNFPYGESLPIPSREYFALQQKYGSEIVSRVTTTPAIGGTGDHDCMIGRVMQKHNQTVLQYGDHYIPLKGIYEAEGVFLVEGMFVKPDLFFVSEHTELEGQTNSIGKAAEN
ncbi:MULTISPECIES: hypothetical protein [unclassified Paenibacillus]|uniref:Uncharacterized protein n=2 Tax=Bacillati TaxID=1783272 RepID=A0ABW3PWW2_9BACL|nr:MULTISPECIES: hypothetical protein [unclassified Paenibacillus]MCM3130191.1 hypothetical protein [Paenibacillus sp. MER 78]SDX71394.1 hypothetical protein SAMN05518848_11283 [Paenibacillus sp. PDC88]SFS88694.1 hypothetical protein SAMN04488601_10679 [Paenibacillus sp. 453mf]